MSAALSHPLFVALVAATLSLLTGIILFLLARYFNTRDKLRATEMAALSERLASFESVQKDISKRQGKAETDLAAVKSEQVAFGTSIEKLSTDVKGLADIVRQLAVALPTNYATNERMDRLEDGIYERLEKIADGVAQKPNRDELERKADRAELAALRTAIAASGGHK